MKRNLCRIGVAATLVMSLLPAAVRAENATYHFRGNTAYAGFETTEGCITASTEVFVYSFPLHEPPGPAPEASPTLFVTMWRHDICNHVFLGSLFGEASLPADAFSVSGGLQTGSLNATLQVQDFSTGSTFPVTVDLTWTGVGEVSRDNKNEHSSFPGMRMMRHERGTSRDAVATGSVLLGTQNLASSPSIYGGVSSSQVGSVFIQRF
ncbi:MAG TPA: hypothetical protein VNM67_06190 [Thermoanaerobaculia bacterium]|jgi:hypothetical protein|nr:hypothetical protein [Thermoanaerobaculia bacterium]